MPDLAAYYDRLSTWTAVARAAGYGGGRETLTVHRALTDPRAGGRPTTTRLHDLLIEALPSLTRPRVLDAGCGFGGTMIDLAARLGGTCVGLTLSERQAAVGTKGAARAGHAHSVRFLVGDYDHPPQGPFDLIVAIESLAHSRNPAVTIAALTARLAHGGLLAIVDDMPAPSITGRVEGSDTLAAFKSGWKCPVLWSAAEYLGAFARHGLALRTDLDLTSQVAVRPQSGIRQLERLNRVMHKAIPSDAWRELMDSYLGGLALERMYRHGLMNYRMLIAAR